MNAFVVATILRTLLSSLAAESAHDEDTTPMPQALAPDVAEDETWSRPDRIEVEIGNDPLAGAW